MINTLFLDIDNTIIFLDNSSKETIQIKPEHKYIHKEVIYLLNKIKLNIPVILISGRRKSSYDNVRGVIPHNFAFIEHGGLIIGNDNFKAIWGEKLKPYCSQFKKHGLLWKVAKELRNKYAIDDIGRLASFRVVSNISGNNVSLEDNIKKVQKLLPRGFRLIINSGMLDIIPKVSGKLNVVKTFSHYKNESIKKYAFIGDDKNDLELLSEVGFPITFDNTDVLKKINKEKVKLFEYGHKGIIRALNCIIQMLK